jgi:hypothetical protein
VERAHQVIGNIIRTFELENNYLDDNDPWKGIPSATDFAVRSTFHTTLQKNPGQLVFGRDIILNVKHEADWEYIRALKQNNIIKNNKAENAKRIPHNNNIGNKVLLKRGTENKYETPYQGPFSITQVNENGTVQMMTKNAYLSTDDIPHGGECSMQNSKVRRENQD